MLTAFVTFQFMLASPIIVIKLSLVWLVQSIGPETRTMSELIQLYIILFVHLTGWHVIEVVLNGKISSLGLIYKLFPHLGSFLKFFSRGTIFYVPCMKYLCKTPAWLARPLLRRHVVVAPLPLVTPVVSPPALVLWPCRVDSLVSLAPPA